MGKYEDLHVSIESKISILVNACIKMSCALKEIARATEQSNPAFLKGIALSALDDTDASWVNAEEEYYLLKKERDNTELAGKKLIDELNGLLDKFKDEEE